MMTSTTRKSWCLSLRMQCFIIAYLNLLACLVDIFCHVLVVSIITNGFQCDIDENSIRQVDWPWLEPILLVLNMGTHGFYSFLLIIRNRVSVFTYLMPTAYESRCYPGMIHINLVDVMCFIINLIWLSFVKSYVIAVHKKEVEPMRMFFGLCIVKMVLQIMYFGYQPDLYSVADTYTIKIMDICIATIFLIKIREYIKELKRNKEGTAIDQPPSYVECLVNVPTNQPKENNNSEPETENKEKKINMEVLSVSNLPAEPKL